MLLRLPYMINYDIRVTRHFSCYFPCVFAGGNVVAEEHKDMPSAIITTKHGGGHELGVMLHCNSDVDGDTL